MLLTVLFLTAPVVSADSRPSHTAYRLSGETRIVVDGQLHEWPAVPPLLLGKSSQVASGAWQGASDSNARASILWDDRNLYFAIVVRDDRVTQDTPRDRAGSMFKSDAIQWAVDLNHDGGVNYSTDNYEYGFGVTGGEPTVYRWFSGGGWPRGIAEHAQLAVSYPPGGIVYEAVVDLSMVAPLRPRDGLRIGFTMVLQDNDDGQWKTLQWTPGVTVGKKPSDFGTLVFSAAAPAGDALRVMVAAAELVGDSGMDVQVVDVSGELDAALGYAVLDLDAEPVARGQLTHRQGQGFVGRVETAQLPPGRYAMSVTDKSGEELARHRFERAPVERIERRWVENAELADELRGLVQEAEAAGVQTRYARSALTAHDIFVPHTREDLDNRQYRFAGHNTQIIGDTLRQRLDQLRGWLESGKGTPDAWRVPELDYGETERIGRYFYVDGRRVLLVGPMSWLWQMHGHVDDIAAMGFNTLRVDWGAHHHFDKKGELRPEEELPWDALHDIANAAERNRMAFKVVLFVPEFLWRGLRRGEAPGLEAFHAFFDRYVARKTRQVGRGRVFAHAIGVESRRAYAPFTPSLHQKKWADYLRGAYTSLDELNQAWGVEHTSFDTVPFPETAPDNRASRYDHTRMRQIMIADEMSRAADVVRRNDPGTLVYSYPYVWTFRDPAAYHYHAVDPELDVANHDIVGCDSSGAYYTERYAMATLTWLTDYYDLTQAIAGDRPVIDGEYHFANKRVIYPPNWARAIHFQSYIHGLSATDSWVWHRGGAIDAALLMDAAVLLGSGEVALDLQRLSEEVTAFHRETPDVVLLAAHPSFPHTIQRDGLKLTHDRQIDMVYEGLFFEGLTVGFVTESQVQQGLIPSGAPLILPHASHTQRATRDAVVRFAKQGGEVLLVGESLRYTPQGLDHNAVPGLDTITAVPGFADPDTARATLLPWLVQQGVGPTYQLKIDNAKPFPTVQWKRATDDAGRELVFILNIGHEPATVTLPAELGQPQDLLTHEITPASFTLDSLDFKLLHVQR